MELMPCIIVDIQGIIMAWYLPGILIDSRQVGLFPLSDCRRKSDTSQNAMLAVQEKLLLLLKVSESGSSWHDDQENFYFRGEGPQGSVNLSPTWFQQGHDVSTSLQRIHSWQLIFESGNVPT